MCECGHVLNVSNTHPTCYSFGDQQIPHMTPLKLSCMFLPLRMTTMYGKNDGTPLHQERHYELIFAQPVRIKFLLLM